MLRKAAFLWSGGKDSSLALYRLTKQRYKITNLVTTINEKYKRVSFHGLSETLLDKQTKALNIKLEKIYLPSTVPLEIYREMVKVKLKALNVKQIAFGDIFLDDLKNYRDKLLDEINIRGLYPLWKEDTTHLYKEFVDLGFKAVIISIDNSKLDKSFLGRALDNDLLKNFPSDVDPCGENGEFHTFVFDGPIFKELIKYKTGEIVDKAYGKNDKIRVYSFLDIN